MNIRSVWHPLTKAFKLRSLLESKFPLPLRERARVRGTPQAPSLPSTPAKEEKDNDVMLQIAIAIFLAVFILLAAATANAASLADTLSKRKPEAIIDLATAEGVQLQRHENYRSRFHGGGARWPTGQYADQGLRLRAARRPRRVRRLPMGSDRSDEPRQTPFRRQTRFQLVPH
jgi:hypothetical protein